MSDAEVILNPGDVARRLGVSSSGLRRLAAVYAEVYGPLQKDAGGTSRLWPPEAVDRLERARALMAAGQARSIKDALLAADRGVQPRLEVAVQDGRVAEALGVVAARLEAVQESNARLERKVDALTERNGQLEQKLSALPAPNTAATEPGGGGSGGGDGILVRLARRLERIWRP